MRAEPKDTTKFKIFSKPEAQIAPLIITWMPDAGKVGIGVAEYLSRKLGGFEFAEMEPIDFFPLDGVIVQDNVAQFPETKFCFCLQKDLLIVRSDLPRSEWYEFLNTMLDIAEAICKVKEICVIGGMASATAHTTPRVLLAVANSSQTKHMIEHYDVVSDMEYETPEGQRPTLNSFLLWIAQRRGIPAVNLWVQVPFYLVAVEDPQAWKKVLDLLNQRFELEMDFTELSDKIMKQHQKIAQARKQNPDLDDWLSRLESNLGLSTIESERLIRKMEELLRQED